MKVMAINSSARVGVESKTELMLNELASGMREAGAEVRVVNLKDYKVKNCLGCFTCWTKTPGICVLKDDMTKDLFPTWLESDLVILASPLYHFTVNATMKTFIERTLPILEPFFVKYEDQIFHSMRHEWRPTVVLSVAGFPQMSVFDVLSQYVNYVFGREDKLWGEIYRPAAESMRRGSSVTDDILAATRRAGRELVEQHGISADTMARITQDVVDDFDAFAAIGNCFWKTCIAEGVTTREFEEKKLMPRPDSVESYMLVMKMGFNPDGAADTACTIQFNFSGEVEGACCFNIHDGCLDTSTGVAPEPDLTINAPFDVWMDIVTGKADGQQLFMDQKYTTEGDINVLMNFGRFFGA